MNNTDNGTEATYSVERADNAFAAGDTTKAARIYAALLSAHPQDLFLWYRSAVLLGLLGETAGATRHLDLVAERLAEQGHPLLAIASVQQLARHDRDRAHKRLEYVAGLYGEGSSRLDKKRRFAPPPLPERLTATSAADPDMDFNDPRLAREGLLDLCEQAVERWREAEDPEKLGFQPLLSELSPEELAAMEPLMQLRVLPAGEVVIEQGAEGHSFFMLVRGTVRVTRELGDDEAAIQLAKLRPGTFFGEMALLTDSPRTAQVTCATAALLFEIDRKALEEMAARNPAVATVLANYTRRRLLRNLMATSPLFRPLDQARRESLVELFEPTVLESGEVVVEEGRSSRQLFVVLTGSVGVTKRDGDEVLTLAELGSGQIFGEISLIKDSAATATVSAVQKTVLLGLSREAFNSHVSEFPEMVAHVYKLAVEREEANVELVGSDTLDVGEDLLI